MKKTNIGLIVLTYLCSCFQHVGLMRDTLLYRQAAPPDY